MIQQIKRCAGFVTGLLFCFVATAQSNINRVEYYIDTDPGYGSGRTVTIIPGTNLTDVSVNLNPDTIKAGVHTFGIRARTATNRWSLDNKWLLIKPSVVAGVPQITEAEYYIDTDLGYGNCEEIDISNATNLSDIIVNINPATVNPGVHIFGIRAKTGNGRWSLDNKWLFVKPSVVAGVPQITEAEYYIDTDLGYGNCEPIDITNGTNLSDVFVNINPSTLASGAHIFGIRAKTGNGRWSLDNKWLLIKPETVATIPNVKDIEYYIDTDPGYGKGIPLAIDPKINFPNFDLPVNISTLDTGKHEFFIRSKDAKGAWSLDNIYEFTVSPAVPNATIVVTNVAQTTLCSRDTVAVSFHATGTYNAGNIFRVQLSDVNGSFTSATLIGDITGTKSDTVKCILPHPVTTGTNYKIRVIATNPVITGVNSIASDLLTVYNGPNTPTVTASGSTTFCSGDSVTLTANTGYASYLWSNGATTRVLKVKQAGNYRVTVTNASGCQAKSAVTVVTVNTLPAATITTTDSTSNLCPADTVTLTASTGNSYLWSNGATTKSISITSPGSYTVTVTNLAGCSKTSVPKVVTYLNCVSPVNLRVEQITLTSVKLLWKPASCGVRYRLRYKPTASTQWKSKVLTPASVIIDSLIPGTTYDWQVQTICKTAPGEIASSFKAGPDFTTLSSFNIAAENYSSKLGDNTFVISVSPNPTENTAILTIQGVKEEVIVSITDITGKLLWKSLKTTNRQVKLPVEKLSGGVYLVAVYNGKERKTLKMVKQ